MGDAEDLLKALSGFAELAALAVPGASLLSAFADIGDPAAPPASPARLEALRTDVAALTELLRQSGLHAAAAEIEALERDLLARDAAKAAGTSPEQRAGHAGEGARRVAEQQRQAADDDRRRRIEEEQRRLAELQRLRAQAEAELRQFEQRRQQQQREEQQRELERRRAERRAGGAPDGGAEKPAEDGKKPSGPDRFELIEID